MRGGIPSHRELRAWDRIPFFETRTRSFLLVCDGRRFGEPASSGLFEIHFSSVIASSIRCISRSSSRWTATTPKIKTTRVRTMGTLGDEHQHTRRWVCAERNGRRKAWPANSWTCLHVSPAGSYRNDVVNAVRLATTFPRQRWLIGCDHDGRLPPPPTLQLTPQLR
jgi:hypothetical protein